MRPSVNVVAALATAATFFAAVTLPASAECKRYGFTVNDYGKDGPTKDAKSLLDKLIATKMAEQGVKDYKTGAKKVSCELFLNFIVFDEHTCTADATVCWGGSALPSSEQAAASDEAEPGDKAKSAAAEPAKHSKKKKEVAAKTSEAAKVTETAKATVPPPAENTAAEIKVPDPKDTAAHAAETNDEAAQPAEAPSNAAATAAASPDATSASTSTTAIVTAPAAAAAASAATREKARRDRFAD